MFGVSAAAVAATSGWTVQPSPTPSGSVSASLQSVSCVSIVACSAVGGYTTRDPLDLTLCRSLDPEPRRRRRTPSQPRSATGVNRHAVAR